MAAALESSIAREGTAVYELTRSFQPIFTGTLLTLFLLAVQHFGLWEIKMPLVARYILGTASIGAGVTLASYLIGDGLIAGVFWAIAIAGGALIAPLHVWRHFRGQLPADINDAFRAGAIVRRALGAASGAPRKPDDRRN
jgi:hypothetical protein